MLTSFDHVTIAVNDLESATDTYQRLLGVAPIWRGTHPALGTAAALFALSNGCVELLAPLAGVEESEALRALLTARGDGVQAIAFGTADAAELSTQLRARGIRATRPQDGVAHGSGGEARSFRTVELSSRDIRGLSVFAVERPEPEALRPTGAVPPDAVDALDHVLVATSDGDASRALYERGLGIRLALDTVFGKRRMLFYRIGGVTLEVVHDPGLGELDAFRGIAYRVRDLQAAHSRLQQSGFPVSELRTGNKPGTQVFTVRGGTCGVPTLFLRDPSRDGAAKRP